MFTGIIEEVGRIRAIHHNRNSARLSIEGCVIRSDLNIGDSVAVNGVCLTATSLDDQGFTADVMHETLDRSSLGSLTVGSRVNLERAMAANGRFGGHIVSGHIDGTGTIVKITKDDNAVWFCIAADPKLLHYIVEKGSITIDGISLTVASVDRQEFAVSTIPHTLAATTLGQRHVGDKVNLEHDVIGKYVEKLLGLQDENSGKKPGLTLEFLTAHGF